MTTNHFRKTEWRLYQYGEDQARLTILKEERQQILNVLMPSVGVAQYGECIGKASDSLTGPEKAAEVDGRAMNTPRAAAIWLQGRPATKKTGQRIVKCGAYPKILPSKAYVEYEADCMKQLMTCKHRFTGKVKITAEYTMPDRRSWPDLTGLMQATGDILEKAEIIANDRDIVSWDGTRIKDECSKERAGVYIVITEETPF